jgi:type I restriction-modification system DNA methylase subunit
MRPQISSFLKQFSKDVTSINRLLVTSYIYINEIKVNNNLFIKKYIIEESEGREYQSLVSFVKLLSKLDLEYDIENLIELFEFVISPAEKEVNGAVYTPQNIREFIVKGCFNNFPIDNWRNLRIADISCGCGGFFISIAEYLKNKIDTTYYDIYNHLYGVDIEEYSIERTKILLTLYAIQNGEDIEDFTFNLFCGNSLNFNWTTIPEYNLNNGFDIIIGNPPYVGASKITEESRQYLSRWSVTKTGKTDLYIPFFQIAIECLKEGGVLGYITVNNFYRSVNGRAFRSYMSANEYNFKIIDFGSEQVFRGRSTYTCICFINKQKGDVSYCKASSRSLDGIINNSYCCLDYKKLDNEKGWLLQDDSIALNIRKIESIGKPLGKSFDIKNGFATLKNDVFILNVINEDTEFYYSQNKSGEIFKIEKDICRNVIKPNTLKSEKEISNKIEKLLFPYSVANGIAKVMEEDVLQKKYPYAYKYLLYNRYVLSQRDKGKREYEQWFAFGRTQAINIRGYKLLFPYIAEYPYFVISEDKDLLFYNGYAIVCDNLHKLKVLQKILRSEVFWYYIKHTSKPYGSDYFALAKNYVKNFGLIELSDKQEEKLMSLKSNMDINNYIKELYGLDI